MLWWIMVLKFYFQSQFKISRFVIPETSAVEEFRQEKLDVLGISTRIPLPSVPLTKFQAQSEKMINNN